MSPSRTLPAYDMWQTSKYHMMLEVKEGLNFPSCKWVLQKV